MSDIRDAAIPQQRVVQVDTAIRVHIFVPPCKTSCCFDAQDHDDLVSFAPGQPGVKGFDCSNGRSSVSC